MAGHGFDEGSARPSLSDGLTPEQIEGIRAAISPERAEQLRRALAIVGRVVRTEDEIREHYGRLAEGASPDPEWAERTEQAVARAARNRRMIDSILETLPQE